MAERKTNEILEQQRKARREFIELKKMQRGEMDTGPKPSEVAIVPKTPMEKLKNIWFHDKWYIIGITALIVVITVMVAQCVMREKYDLKAVAYSYYPITDDNIELISEYLEKYCDDTDGNGEVNIQVVNCTFSKESGDKQYQNTIATKLQAILAYDADTLLYITDDQSYDYLNSIVENGKIFEGEPVVLGDKFYEECNSKESLLPLPEGLQISCRVVEGTTIAENDNIKKYYEQSKNVLKGIEEENK